MSFAFLQIEDDSARCQQVLASCLQNNDLVKELPVIVNLMGEPFRTIAAGIVYLSSKHGFVDLASLSGYLKKSKVKGSVIEAANGLQGVPLNLDRAKVYIDTYRQNLDLKRLELLKNKLISSIESAGNFSDLEQSYSSLLTEASFHESRGTGTSGLLDLLDYTKNLQVNSIGRDYLGFDSGFKHLNLIYNGMSPGLHVIAAVPGCGKSTFAWQIANQISTSRVPVVFIHFEQSKKDLLDKALARITSLNSRHISRGKIVLDSFSKGPTISRALKQYAETIAPWTVIHEADEKTDIIEIEKLFRDSLKRLGAEKGVLVVDYLQMIPVNKDVAGLFSTMDKTTHNLGALRRIARDYEVPVLTISSMNRANYKSKSMAGFKESGNVEYAADTAAILFQEGGFCEKSRSKSLSLNVLKNRNGETARIDYKFYPEFARFVEERSSPLDSEAND